MQLGHLFFGIGNMEERVAQNGVPPLLVALEKGFYGRHERLVTSAQLRVVRHQRL